MQMQLGKRRLSGGLVLAVGFAACAGSLVAAESSFAAAPTGGINCVSSDGKVNGRGSTFQTRAQGDFWAAYNKDVCGAVASQGANDTAVAGNMGVYNYSSTGGFTGSGAGLKAANCRTDAYSGTDLPYSETQLGQLNGTPGNATLGGCGTFPVQPFTPNASTNTGTPAYPNSADKAAKLMAFPIAGSSVDIAVNLKSTDCTSGVTPNNLAFTGAQMNLIWAGDVLNWNDPALRGPGTQNSSLSTCNVTIKRVVRQDTSGTTSIFKNYLQAVAPTRAGEACNPGVTWISLNPPGGTNTGWPSGTGTCSPLVVPASSGGTNLVNALGATAGGVGYADLADVVQGAFPALVVASVENGAATGFVSPNSGTTANCDFSVLTLPGGTGSDAVGLNTTDNWGNDNAAGDHINATNLGSNYPICGLTFDLVYSKLSTAAATNPIVGLTADQRRTMYSYFTYVLSSTAQNQLPNDFYAAVPDAWVPFLLSGFQSNF